MGHPMQIAKAVRNLTWERRTRTIRTGDEHC